MDYQEFPRYVRFVNTSAYIVPPFAIMKVVGVNSDGDLEIDRPTVDNDNSGIICNLATPVEAGAKGIAQLNEPFTMGSVGMGPPPSAGEVWGVKKDTWELCRDRVGFRIMAVGDANYVVACRMEGQYFQRVIVTGAAASGFYPATEQRYNSANDTWVSYDTVLLRSDESFSVNGTVYAQRVSHNGTYPIFLPLSITSSESSTTTVTTEPSVEPPVPMELEGNNGSAYGWVEKYQLSNGTMTDKVGGRTGNLTLHTLYEVNGVSGLENGTIVFGFPGYGWDTEAVVGINQTGNGTLPHIHSLYISNETTGGNYTLSYTTNGTTYEETAPIDWDANATVLETALEALAGIGDLTITGDGNITSPFLIEHPANGSQYSLVPDSTNLTGAQLWIFEHQGGPGLPNLSLQYRKTNGTFGGLENTTANLTYGVPSHSTFTASTLLGLDGDKVYVPYQIGSGLVVTGSGRNVTLTAAGGNGTPGAPNGSMQFNSGGAFGGVGDWNNTVVGDLLLPGNMALNSTGAGFLRIGVLRVRPSDTGLTIGSGIITDPNGTVTLLPTGITLKGWNLTVKGTASPSAGEAGLEYIVGAPTTVLRLSPDTNQGADNSTFSAYENGSGFNGRFTTQLGMRFVGGLHVSGNATVLQSDVDGLTTIVTNANLNNLMLPMGAVSDATDLTDIVAQFNDLLSKMRTANLLS